MIVLAIDTATPQVSVALGGPEGILAEFSAAAGRRHSETVAPAIALVSEAAGVALAGVDRVAVDIGPGLFTGLRVGVATAAAIATALDRPVVPVSSLDLLASPYAGDGRAVAAVVDARRSEVFWALYRPGEGQVSAPAVAAPEELAGTLARIGGVLAVGDGAARYREVLAAGAGVEVRGGYPSALDLARLGATRPEMPASQIHPLYLRQADVRIGWRERVPQAAGG